MRYTVQKENAGSPKVYSGKKLIRALMKAGAVDAELVGETALEVKWASGRVAYYIDENGVIDPQLAWDME